MLIYAKASSKYKMVECMNNGFFSDVKKNKHVKNFLEKKLEKYGAMNYVYAVMNKANTHNMMIISNLPDNLVANYLNKKTQNIDPVIICALNRVTSFFWDKDMKINSQWTMKRVLEPVKSYDVVGGYAFVLHDHKNNLVLLSLYIDKYLIVDGEEIIKKSKDEFQLLLLYAHEMLTHAYHDSNIMGNNILSSRESEILFLCSTGKTYCEISDLLCISISTVKFHMSKVVKKMGARNARHAVSLSGDHGKFLGYQKNESESLN